MNISFWIELSGDANHRRCMVENSEQATMHVTDIPRPQKQLEKQKLAFNKLAINDVLLFCRQASMLQAWDIACPRMQ